jgi:hypothetical protein
MKNTAIFFLVSLCFLISCTVQKRIHQRGYFVQWKHKPAKTLASENLTEPKNKTAQPASTPAGKSDGYVMASSTTELQDIDYRKTTAFSYTATECDVIVMRNGEEIQAKVFEVTSSVIKYRRCDLPDGPLYTVNKSEVFMLKYPNGVKELMPAGSGTSPGDYNNKATAAPVKRKIEPLALTSFIASLATLLFPASPVTIVVALFILAVCIVMSVIALTRINAAPDRLKGKAFAIIALVVSIIFGFLLLLLLTLI